jgi:hypothetical protein
MTSDIWYNMGVRDALGSICDSVLIMGQAPTIHKVAEKLIEIDPNDESAKKVVQDKYGYK